MGKPEISAEEWLLKNDPSYRQRTKVRNLRSSQEKSHDAVAIRRKRLGKNAGEPQFQSIREFVEGHRGSKSKDCIFVPAAVTGRPAQVHFCGKTISAARYMALLTHGAPKSEGMVVRHLCGCGHLSCVNPNHLVWGSPSDNIADANKHRNAGANTQDRIHAID